MRPLCETPSCKRPADFRVWRLDKIASKIFCHVCLAVKVGKYDLRAERLK